MSHIKLFEASTQASHYAKIRPESPPQIIERIIHYLSEKFTSPFERAADVGCGSGQSTTVLAPYFKEVVGSDISEAQIQEAQKKEKCNNVVYEVGSSDNIPVPDSSVQLVTVATAIHWFDLPTFYKEVERVLVPGGVLAVYGYWFPIISGFPKADEMNQALKEIYGVKLDKYWHPNSKNLDELYKKIELPYPEQKREEIDWGADDWSVDDLICLIQTWSAYQTMFEKERAAAEEMIAEFRKKLGEILGAKGPDAKFSITWHFCLLLSRKP